MRASGLLIATGVVLIVLAFLLAFTIFGELAAVIGVGLVIIGGAMTGRRPRKVVGQPGEH